MYNCIAKAFKSKYVLIIGIPILLSSSLSSCKKLVQIPAPVNTITSAQIFSDSSDVAGAISGIYSQIINSEGGGIGFCNGSQTLYCGLSSDELLYFFPNGSQLNFYMNALLSRDGIIANDFWAEPYNFIYQANACIEGIQNSKTISTATKNQYLGEAKFLRALFYFYLVNLYGEVPIVTSTAWATTSLSKRGASSLVYQQIVSDLKDAQALLPTDYSFNNGFRTRANHWAATALLARVYLYTGDWANAVTQSTAIINNSSLFGLTPDLNSVFLVNSSESILQWQLNTSFNNFTATPEGATLIPSSGSNPQYYLTTTLLNSFEPGDKRKTAWLDSVNYNGANYYVPYKYKIGQYNYTPNGTPIEYYTVLRLAEQYLIRAEAEANETTGASIPAIADLNIIRARAGGIPPLSPTLTHAQILASVAHERQIELFAEWGHRWFDLKRTGQATTVLTADKGFPVNNNSLLYPIPQGELNLDPNLTQNPGY